MRSPVLVFSLVAAAATTISAQGNGSPGLPLSPHLKGHAGAFQMKTPRQYGEGAYRGPEDADREIAAEHRDREETSRLDNPRPPQPHLGAEDKFGIPATAGTMDGGFSDSGPAVGADAGEGGSSASSAQGKPASGSDLLRFGNVTGDFLHGASTSSQDAVPARANGGYGDRYMDENAYSYNRMKRIVRTELRDNMSKRADWGTDPLSIDEPDNENSGQDGPNGNSQRGTATPGSGPYGGQAHSGQVGSSDGGHVYNEPASNDT